MRRLLFYLLAGWLCCLTGCMDDESYTTSPNDVLVFSRDTLSFDTVFSGQPTNTYTFEVYNPADKAIRIPEIRLEQGAASPYRVNVDGTFLEGGVAGGFEIAARDSMRVFLFLHPRDEDSDLPVACHDRLVFRTEAGVESAVELLGYGQSVYRLKGWVVEADTVLASPRPFQVLDSLVVAPGALLTLAPGTKLYFHSDAGMRVDGTLWAVGTLDEPVLMRGDRLGNMFTEQSYDAIPGQWQGITFGESSYDNYLSYCDIHSGTYGLRLDSCDMSRTKLQIENSIVHNVVGHAIEARSARLFVGNSQVTNAGGDCLHLRGGHYTFVHCTIGNFYPFAGGKGVALDFSNIDGESRLPVEQLAFVNSILTGSSSDEIMGYQSDRYVEDAFRYVFMNCLLNTPEVEDAGYVNPTWDTDEETAREKNFLPAHDLDKLLFPFTLNPASRAVGIADTEWTAAYYPTDRLGRPRLTDGKADAGCYEAPEPEIKE